MDIKNSFKAFANRVIHSLRMGKLNEKDIKIVQRLLIKTGKKNLILSNALLSTLTKGEQSEQDVKRFAHLLDLANRRITEDKEPFSAGDKNEIEEIFKRHSLSTKAAKKFTFGIDELLTMELKSELEKSVILPKKQLESCQRNEEKEKLLH